MKGVVKIEEFVEHLKENDLVIVPKDSVQKDEKMLQNELLSQSEATYAEIFESRIWGDITRKRVYQIAKEEANVGEIVLPENSKYREKLVITAVRRIAEKRKTL